MKPGQSVTFVDADGVEQSALIAKVGGDQPGPKELDLSLSPSGEAVGVKHVSVAAENEPHWK